jgi:hypothetical protein
MVMFVLPAFGQRSGPLPPGIRLGLQRPHEFAFLPLSDSERALLAKPDRRTRVGVHRTLPTDALTSGQWDIGPGGEKIWRMALRSPGSSALRVEFRDFDVGTGRVWLHNGDQVAGPYTGRGVFGDGRFWSSSTFGESAILEYEPATDVTDGALPFEVRTISHQASALPSDSASLVNPVPAAGFKDTAAYCHLDPNCYPEWRDTMKMVAQLAYEDVDGSYLCSGSLISTRDNSLKPYLLTAGHCLHNEAAARSLQTYWTYQTAACTAAPPVSRESSTKSTQGASLLAFAPIEGGDYSLLLLRDIPPGVQFAAWDMADPPIGSAVVGVHHPAGSYKRISFGTRGGDATEDVEGSIAPGDLFMEIFWDKGRIEHGSSGSPLFSGPGVIVGVLSYGLFSPDVTVCEIDPSFSGYGRFSKIYEHIKDYLENLPAASVTPQPSDVRITAVNGVSTPAKQQVRLTTNSAGEVSFKLRADEPWIRLSTVSGTVSASNPATVDISLDLSKFDRPDKYQSTVTILSGAANPQFINVFADVRADRSNVVATVTPNPVLSQPASPRYSFKLRLEEKAGFATRLTAVKLNGYDLSASITDWFGTNLIPAKGKLEADLSTDFPFTPGPQYFEFWGVDEAGGQHWYTTTIGTF